VTRAIFLLLMLASAAPAQVYSPRVLLDGQPDPTDLVRFANGICARAGAATPRARAEAIWRFFLTDGRFVEPGFWYHIAGWAYEEPAGEVLDSLKLINSYGFGLCYHIAPLLADVWKAAGFADARVWFLTGHTVAEVFYDGAYHHYDSDMLGYSTLGRGSPRASTVASVHQLEADPSIILSKLKSPREVDPKLVDQPWYPADVRAGAIGGLAGLFSTASDNSVFPFERSPAGYRPDFVLRPGERLVRYFHPERPDLYYLPYKFDGESWTEFPQEVAEYQIRTADGPRSQKDARTWGTGRLEYRPPLTGEPVQLVTVQSPYVIIDAAFELEADVANDSEHIELATSTDDGRTWSAAGALRRPFSGKWTAEPAILTRSAHGRRTAVSGRYGYLLRLTRSPGAGVRSLLLSTRVQLNPRTLPALANGHNQLTFQASTPRLRTPLAVSAAEAKESAVAVSGARFVSSRGQGYWMPSGTAPAEFVFRMSLCKPIAAFDAGARFLDLSRSLGPDKFTAEVRAVAPLDSASAAASIAWSANREGPFHIIWTWDPHMRWKDDIAIDRTLLWPEVARRVLNPGSSEVFIRYRLAGLAIDDFRLSAETIPAPGACPVEITHLWKENGSDRSATRRVPAGTLRMDYAIDTTPGAAVSNEAVILECRPAAGKK
jgi:hypothetical protein